MNNSYDLLYILHVGIYATFENRIVLLAIYKKIKNQFNFKEQIVVFFFYCFFAAQRLSPPHRNILFKIHETNIFHLKKFHHHFTSVLYVNKVCINK